MTKQTANIFVRNGFSTTMRVHLYHWNSDYGLQQAAWTIDSALSGPTALQVSFNTGLGSLTTLDYWYVTVSPVLWASGESWYTSVGIPNQPQSWTECQLQGSDDNDPTTFVVSPDGFQIVLDSGGRTTGWNKFAGSMNLSGVNFTNVFVLMLENHSFDNMLAFSGIPGITAATTENSNTIRSSSLEHTYNVTKDAPSSMTTDPGHEFDDVLEQLGGQGAKYTPGEYPSITMGGFAANYATSVTEKTGRPAIDHIGDIMACFDTRNQLPVMHKLAKEFTVCDHWFSSMPGPTWPNRYFVHGASSSGLDDSPSEGQIKEWETVSGFTYPNSSLYEKLDNLGQYGYRIYRDPNGTELGEIPQVCSLKGISLFDANSIDDLASDLSWPYPYRFTFIEPNYGDIYGNTYSGGTSQHPMDDVSGGEGLIKKVYEAIRNSPLWNDSLLIVTYDEHGGFYDSVAPGPCTSPNDGSNTSDLNTHGFDFTTYGVRVPAIVVSTMTAAGVSQLTYDHASIPATVMSWLGMGHLTDRDLNANNVIGLTKGPMRTDCPTTLPDPAAPAPTPSPSPEEDEVRAGEALPERGNHWGFLQIAAKAEFEMSSRTDEERAQILARLRSIKTRGQARDYVRSVMRRAKAERARRQSAPPPAPPPAVE